MYLNVFNSGLVLLDLYVEYLSVDDLPNVVNVSFDISKLRYQCGRDTLCKPIIEDSVR